MKKIISIVTILAIICMFTFSINVYADSLQSINVTLDKEKVHPGEEIKVNIDFGEDLGAYTANIAYDNNLLEYVSSEGGTANDNSTRVKVYFYDETGGSNPRRNMSVTFKAKEGIDTSNPTEFSITLEGLANPDASVNYDDVLVPIIKDVTVEPMYQDYKIALNYTGDILINAEKDMDLVISSAMGKNYEHTRILGSVNGPEGSTAKLLATDSNEMEHDIFQSGWGEAQGDPIGGKDVNKVLKVRGLFSKAGEYEITLKLVDRDASDAEIAKQTFKVVVKEETEITPPEEKPEEKPVLPETGDNNNKPTKPEVSKPENMPETLPKTGNTVYLSVGSILVVLSLTCIALRKKD